MNSLTLILGSVLSIAGGVFITTSYLPQITQLYKTKKSDDLSISFWVILILGLICTTSNMILNNSPLSILLPQFLNIILAIIVLAQVVIYKRKR